MVPTLREVRADRLLSMADLAKLAGVAVNTLNSIENGHRTPRNEVIRKVSHALGVEPTHITEFRAAIEERKRKASE